MAGELLHVCIEEPDEVTEQERHVLALLERANVEAGYPRDERRFFATIRRSDGSVQGGITARSFWGWLYIVSLAVEPAWRGHGYGGRLMATAERWGTDCGCHSAWLMTMTFQARGFYERAGYRLFAELPNFPENHSRLFMRKPLTGAGVEPQSGLSAS